MNVFLGPGVFFWKQLEWFEGFFVERCSFFNCSCRESEGKGSVLFGEIWWRVIGHSVVGKSGRTFGDRWSETCLACKGLNRMWIMCAQWAWDGLADGLTKRR